MESGGTNKLQLKTVDQIGIVVKDIDKIIETWSSMFGIGPWTFRETAGSDAKGRSWKVRLAFAYLGPLQIELIQPVEGRTSNGARESKINDIKEWAKQSILIEGM